MCVLIRVASRYHLTFTTEYIHNVLKTFLPLVTRPYRFDQITRGKIKPRTEGLKSRSDGGHFDFHIVKGTRGGWKRAEFKNPWGVGTLAG